MGCQQNLVPVVWLRTCVAVAIFHAKFALFGPALHFDKEGWKQRISQGRHHQRSALMRRMQVAEKLMQASVCNLLS